MPVALPLIELGALYVALLCIALALLIVDIILVLANGFKTLPFPLNKIGDGLGWVAHAIAGVLGKAEAGVDAAVGASWHALAWFARAWWHEIETAFWTVAGGMEWLARVTYSHVGLKALVHAIRTTVHGIEHGVKVLEREYHGIEHRVGKIEHEIANGIGNDVITGLHNLEKEVGVIEDSTIPALQRGIDGVTGELTQLEQFIKALPGVNYLDWAAGIVAVAFASLGWSWFKCKEWRGLGSRLTCGMGQLLLDVLEGAIAVMLVSDICDITGVAIAVLESSEVQGFLSSVEGGLADLIDCQGVGLPAALTGPYYAPPPVQPYAVLA